MKLNHETSNVAAFSRNLERELENLGHSAYIAPTDHHMFGWVRTCLPQMAGTSR